MAQGTPCVLVRLNTPWWYCIDLQHVLLAATTGCGKRPPGSLVCGYDYCKVCVFCQQVMKDGACPKCGGTHEEPSQGWILGHFETTELQHIYDNAMLAFGLQMHTVKPGPQMGLMSGEPSGVEPLFTHTYIRGTRGD
jgi:hypothetical protein